MKPLAGLIAGMLLGSAPEISAALASTEFLLAVFLAAADSLIGGICAGLDRKFSDAVLFTGFLVNVLFAAALVGLGKFFGVEICWLALLIFGLRIFKNLTTLKNWLERKYLS